MNHRERVGQLLKGEAISPPGVALWKHFSIDDLNSEDFSRITVDFQNKYNWDFIKISFHGLYPVENWGAKINWAKHRMEAASVAEFAIKNPADWAKLEVLPVTEGALARELESTRKIIEKSDGETPILPTVFSPATIAKKMSGDIILEHFKTNKKEVHQALMTITKTTVDFVKALLNLGVDGIFFATQLATYDLISLEEYKEFGVEYDLQILEEVRGKTTFNILHVHGENSMFKDIMDYPVQAINWHDRVTFPTLKEAREITDKILIGGIDELNLLKNGDEDALKAHVQDALNQVPDGKLILGPGCVVPLDCPDEQMLMLKKVVSKF